MCSTYRRNESEYPVMRTCNHLDPESGLSEIGGRGNYSNESFEDRSGPMQPTMIMRENT